MARKIMAPPPKTRSSIPSPPPLVIPPRPEIPYSAEVESQLEYIFQHAPSQKLMLVDAATREMMRDRLGATGNQLRRWWIGRQSDIRKEKANRRPSTRKDLSRKDGNAEYSELKEVASKEEKEEATASFAKLMREAFRADSEETTGNRALQLETALKQLVDSNVRISTLPRTKSTSKVFVAETDDIDILEATRLEMGTWFRVSEPARSELVVYYSHTKRSFVFWTPHEDNLYRVILPLESISNLKIFLNEKANKSLLIFHRSSHPPPHFEISPSAVGARKWIRTDFDWTCEQQASTVSEYSVYVDDIVGMMEVVKSIGWQNAGWSERVFVGELPSGGDVGSTMEAMSFPPPLPTTISQSSSTSRHPPSFPEPPPSYLQPNSPRNILNLTSLASLSPLDSLPPQSTTHRARGRASVTIRRGEHVGKRVVFKDITKRSRVVKSDRQLRGSSRVGGGKSSLSQQVSGDLARIHFAEEDDASEEGVPDLIHSSSPTPALHSSPLASTGTPFIKVEEDEYEFSFAYPHDQFEDLYTPTSHFPHYRQKSEGLVGFDHSQNYKSEIEEQGISLYDHFNIIPSPEKRRLGAGFDGSEEVYGKFGDEEWEIRSVTVVEENGRATLTSSPPRGQ